MNSAATNEQQLLMKDSHGKEITITLVSEDVIGDPPHSRLLSAKTQDGRSVSFDQMNAAWVIEDSAELLTPINSRL